MIGKSFVGLRHLIKKQIIAIETRMLTVEEFDQCCAWCAENIEWFDNRSYSRDQEMAEIEREIDESFARLYRTQGTDLYRRTYIVALGNLADATLFKLHWG